MSANLIVDLGGSVALIPSVVPANGVGSSPASGIIVGAPVDLLYANTYCNMLVNIGPNLSGGFKVLVQTSDATTSGSFTDPTSGLAQLPTSFSSGGVFAISGIGSPASGLMVSAAFQRPQRYARAVVMSGDQANAPVSVGFISQLKTTGSGGGFSPQPGSGTVNV